MKDRKKPAIRFKGFTEDWEQRKLNKISDKVTEKNIGLQYIETFTNSAEFGIISQRDFFDHEIANMSSLGGYYIVRSEDFVYNPRISATAPVGPINRNKLGRVGVMSPLYTVFRTYDVDTTYLEYFFKSRYWHSFMNFNGDSGARSDRFSIKDAIFFEMNIPIPHIEEQMKIGEYLTHIDNLITLHQRKYDKLVNVKKSMLEKMFPKNGESIPDIRFSVFTEAWEQRKLGEIAEIRRGLTYKPDDVKTSGIRVLRSSNINEEYFETYKDDIFVDEIAINIPYVKNGDIIITSANGSSRLVGKHAIIKNIPDNAMVHGGFMLVASTNEPEFLNSSMSSPWYVKFINIYVAGGNGAIGNLSKRDLDNQEILVPYAIEQQKIGIYFQHLDNLITLHQRKLEKLKNIKKSCLEKMFI